MSYGSFWYTYLSNSYIFLMPHILKIATQHAFYVKNRIVSEEVDPAWLDTTTTNGQ